MIYISLARLKKLKGDVFCFKTGKKKKSPKTVMQRLCSIFKPLIQSICDI
jgi:hypothetical protein